MSEISAPVQMLFDHGLEDTLANREIEQLLVSGSLTSYVSDDIQRSKLAIRPATGVQVLMPRFRSEQNNFFLSVLTLSHIDCSGSAYRQNEHSCQPATPQSNPYPSCRVPATYLVQHIV